MARAVVWARGVAAAPRRGTTAWVRPRGGRAMSCAARSRCGSRAAEPQPRRRRLRRDAQIERGLRRKNCTIISIMNGTARNRVASSLVFLEGESESASTTPIPPATGVASALALSWLVGCPGGAASGGPATRRQGSVMNNLELNISSVTPEAIHGKRLVAKFELTNRGMDRCLCLPPRASPRARTRPRGSRPARSRGRRSGYLGGNAATYI